MNVGPLSLLFVISRFHPVIGGGEMQALRLAQGLVKRGHRITVLTMRHEDSLPQAEDLAGVHVLRMGAGTGAFALSVIRHLWHVRHRYDAVHAFQALSPALAVALAGPLVRRPTLLTLFAGGFHKEEGDLFMALRRSVLARVYPRALRCFDRIIVKSDESAREVQTHLGRDAVLIPNGVDVEMFRPASSVSEDPVACFVGRLEAVKAPEVLFEAWKHVVRSLPQARLRVVGDGDAASRFRACAVDAGVEQTVEFLGRQAHVLPYLQAARLLVLPSHSEGMPGVILEAMACGLPVVSTDVGQVSRMVQHRETGYVVPPGQPEALGGAMLEVLSHPQVASEMGQKARQHVESTFSLDACVQRYEELYRSLASRSGEPR